MRVSVQFERICLPRNDTDLADDTGSFVKAIMVTYQMTSLLQSETAEIFFVNFSKNTNFLLKIKKKAFNVQHAIRFSDSEDFSNLSYIKTRLFRVLSKLHLH